MYRILDEHSVIDYLRGRPEAARIVDTGGPLKCTEIGDGNLNLVFRIYESDDPRRSILLKQALPHVRVATDWKLSTVRGRFEALSLQQYHRHCPGSVPEPYFYDDSMFLVGMQDLNGYQVVRYPMIEGRRYPGIGRTIGHYMAVLHYATSDFALDPAEKKAQVAVFSENSELCRITEDLILTEPFFPEPARNKWTSAIEPDMRDLQADESLRAPVGRLKFAFMTATEALLHGDLHSGSIMSDGQDIRMIDSEFAFYGPMGLDVGLFIANLLLNSAAHEVRTPDREARSDYRRYITSEIRECWQTYERELHALMGQANSPSWRDAGFRDAFLQHVLRDSVGFAGCEMIRRTIGFAHVADLDGIADEQERAVAQGLTLRAGRDLIKSHEAASSIEDLIETAARTIKA